MSQEIKTSISETRAYISSNNRFDAKTYKGKRPDLKYNYYDTTGHTRDRCWILHLELKPKTLRENKGSQKSPSYRLIRPTMQQSLQLRECQTSQPILQS